MLSILGFHFDSRLTWGYMIDTIVQCYRQRLECLQRISEYLGTETIDGTCREHLQLFCSAFLSSISLPWRSQCLNILRPYVFVGKSHYNYLLGLAL